MSIEKKDCPHLSALLATPPAKTAAPPPERPAVCEECGVDAPLRVCVTCGHVGCCETTRGHAAAHARARKHPVIRQLPARDTAFTWCYDCNDYLR